MRKKPGRPAKKSDPDKGYHKERPKADGSRGASPRAYGERKVTARPDKEEGSEEAPRYKKRTDGDSRPPRAGGAADSYKSKRPYSGRPTEGDAPRYKKREEGDSRPPRREGGDDFKSKRPYGSRPTGDAPHYKKREDGDAPRAPRREGDSPRPPRREGGDDFKSKRPYGSRPTDGDAPRYKKREEGDAPRAPRREGDSPRPPRKDDRGDYKGRIPEKSSRDRAPGEEKPYKRPYTPNDEPFADYGDEPVPRIPRRRKNDNAPEDEAMPLNKYLAHSGASSRREAAVIVKQGKVKVNGELITDPGHRVQNSDVVTLLGKRIFPQKNKVYVLLNKPKGYITTTDDPEGRRTVMDLVLGAGSERLFPIGRLDRNTTGLIILTNDGGLTQKLSHPSYEIKKVYQVSLDKPLTQADFDAIIAGVTLEDGVAQVDAMAYLEDKKELGLEIHSGRNRIVRRIFESLGYEVEKLDRVMYAGLTKKNLPRGKWRFLSEKELILLKHFKN